MTPEQEQIRDLAREFAENEIIPHAAAWDRESELPRAVIDKLGELGFLGMLIPEEWDGLGLDVLSYLVALEEIARGDASVAVAMSVHNSLPTQMILANGSAEQKERWLKPMARGELLGAFSLSEPDSGSDAASMQAQARRADGGWVLNGAKAWVTNGGFGDVVVTMVRTDQPANRRGSRGIGAFIVPTDTQGYGGGRKEDKMVQGASETVEVPFEEIFIPDQQVLGDPDLGFIYAMQGLNGGPMGIAALALGIAQAALEHAVAYAGERRQFGRPIKDFQGMQFKLADMATRVEAARGLLHRAAIVREAGQKVSSIASMA